MISINDNNWITLNSNIYVHVKGDGQELVQKKIIRVYAGEKRIYPVEYDWIARSDSIIVEPLLISENNGNRSPVYKAYKGRCAGLISTDFHGDVYGGNWIGCVIVSLDRNSSTLNVPVPNLNVIQINDVNVYIGWCSTNADWGGGTIYSNPLNLPVVNEFMCPVNGSFNLEQATRLFEILDFHIIKS